MSNSCIYPTGRALSGTTTPGESGLVSDVIEEVLLNPQSSCITRASTSDCLVCYEPTFTGTAKTGT